MRLIFENIAKPKGVLQCNQPFQRLNSGTTDARREMISLIEPYWELLLFSPVMSNDPNKGLINSLRHPSIGAARERAGHGTAP